MNKADQIQVQLFDKVKTSRGNNPSPIVNELSDLLNISTDSAYRRMRGETPLTLSELMKINDYYKLSVNDFFVDHKDSIAFDYNWPTTDHFEFTGFLEYVLKDLTRFSNGNADETLVFNAKDVPTFYFFILPEISAFKGFFWEKTFRKSSQMKSNTFDLNALDAKSIELGNCILEKYNEVNSIELWGDEILNSTLSQIGYYHESEAMDKATAKILLEKIDELIDHMQLQCEYGTKFRLGETPTDQSNLKVYYNEVLIGDNTIVLKTKTHKMVFLSKNVVGTLVSNNAMFCDHTWNLMENLMNRSTLISESAEKERNRYFNRLRKKVEKTRIRLFI